MRTKSFTLVEMVTVVAIVMVLAAIAVPQLAIAQWKAKRAELAPNVESILDSQLAYTITYGAPITAAAWRPTVTLGKKPNPWPSGTEFNTLGWRPDGDVRGQYFTDVASVVTCNTAIGHGGNALYAAGRIDVNGDGNLFDYYSCDYEPAGGVYKDRWKGSGSGFTAY